MNSLAVTTQSEEVSSSESALAPKESAQVLPMEAAQPLSLTPRDINAHLARTLAQYDKLTAQFAQNKSEIDAELAALRQAGDEKSSEMARLRAALSEQSNAQKLQAARAKSEMDGLKAGIQSELAQLHANGQIQLQALGRRLDADLQRLHQGVCAVDDMLANQSSIVREQGTLLDQFDIAYQLLDTETRGNRSRIETVREEAHRQHAIALTQLAGLEALQSGQSAELAELRETVNSIQAESQRLDGAIEAVAQNLETHVAETQRTFQRTHIAAATLLLVVAGGFAMVKWVPAFAPASSGAGLARAQEHLIALDAQVAALPAVQAVAAAQDSKLTALTDTVKALERRVGVVQTSVGALRDLVALPLGSQSSGLPLETSQWLLQQDPTALTVQLAGLSSDQAVKAFLAQHETALAGKRLALSVTQPAQGTRYNLFYGVFGTLEQARAAMEALPAEMRSQQPWVRTMAAVQTTLR